MLRLAFATNESRSRYLFDELSRQAKMMAPIEFDQIDVLTKYAAAVLTYRRPRSEWWDAYQMHPLLQRRRRTVLARGLTPQVDTLDALLMWGSWFHPFRGRERRLPFFHYIDQSHALTPILGEPAVSPRGRARAHALQAETYHDAAGILCMSDWARQQTAAAHNTVPSEKLHVVGWGPCAVDLSHEDPQSEREPIVLHVSTSFYRKGVDFLLEVAPIVAAAVPGARFIVVGGDVEGMPVRPTQHVEFTGAVTDRARLAEYFRRAALFFLPHRFDRSPHVLVEAMSASMPVVASAQGGSIELVEGNEAGYCVPVGDVRAYANAIIGLLSDRGARSRMGGNGRAAVRRQYNWAAVATAILRIVEQAAARRARP